MYAVQPTEPTEFGEARFDKPFKELFLWAVLMNRPALARFFWERTDHPVMNALVASRINNSLFQLASENANSHFAAKFRQQSKFVYGDFLCSTILDIGNTKIWPKVSLIRRSNSMRIKRYSLSSCLMHNGTN
jgi:hypothetical protein